MYKRLFESTEARREDFKELWNAMAKHGELKLAQEPDLLKYLDAGGFFTAPASTKYHGNWEGGLYEHSRAVFLRLQELTDKLGLEWLRPESPFIVGMFHDLCKCDAYIENEDYGSAADVLNPGAPYMFNERTLLKGHGDKSLMILSTLLKLTEEEMLCIRYHMGAYEKDDWAGFDMAIREYPNVLFAHTADMLASKVDGI